MIALTQLTPSTALLVLRIAHGAPEVAVLFWMEKQQGGGEGKGSAKANDTRLRVGLPIAALSGSVTYYPATATPAQQRAVNAFQLDTPHCRMSEAEFSFVLGSCLTMGGLPLTRITKETSSDA